MAVVNMVHLPQPAEMIVLQAGTHHESVSPSTNRTAGVNRCSGLISLPYLLCRRLEPATYNSAHVHLQDRRFQAPYIIS